VTDHELERLRLLLAHAHDSENESLLRRAAVFVTKLKRESADEPIVDDEPVADKDAA
jgi:hypothetical protein